MVVRSVGNYIFPSRLHKKRALSAFDRRLKTKKAAEHAFRVAEAVANPIEGNSAPSAEALFIALNTCAYRAVRRMRLKPPSADDRTEWAVRWNLIRDHIVQQNLGLAYSMISRFRTIHPDWEELRSEALLALVRAVEGFNPWRGVRFSTYACNAIMRSMIYAARMASKYRLRFPVEHDILMERPTRIDGWLELYVDRLHQALDLNLGALTERESTILHRRFPLDGQPGLTLEEIGDTIGLSKERVRQIQKGALAKLREVLQADPSLQ